ncbi:hypothetical protein MPH_01391 [Macrophomina phaseolina MS6]|uniref:Uncharacterized protein n=1 Tax=Macrophomina phaseolina (strain MS6) TaxID=1126212 RepID=K2S2Q1_MACPH|nr:hypothetical protein MPH_01391 [Macrophomina phaseolina MS6]
MPSGTMTRSEPLLTTTGKISRSDGRAGADWAKSGREGAGMLDHRFGHGEYLDRVAISKARNAVRYGLGDLNALPIASVHLSNFVVDDTSFSKYFDGIRKIVFCKGCVDAGFVLPKNLNDKVQLFTCGKGIGEVDAQDMLEAEVKTVSEKAA